MMQTRRETFEISAKPMIELKDLPSGQVVFVEGEGGRVEVEIVGENAEAFVAEQDGGGIFLRAPQGRGLSRWGDYAVRVTTPAVAELSVNVASADVDVRVEVDELGVNSASGDVRIRKVTTECGVNSASGDVKIGEVSGECGVNSASGDVEISSASGELGVRTASGDVRIKLSSAEVGLKAASGDLVVERYEGPRLECVTQSGDVRIGLPGGRDIDLQLDSLSGEIDVRTDGLEDAAREEPGEPMRLSARTLSGDITLFGAQG